MLDGIGLPNRAGATEDSCLGDFFSPFQNVCSGHGSCLASTESTSGFACSCDGSWVGASNWVNLDGRDCHVNVIVLRVLWSVLLAMLVVFHIMYFGAYWKAFMRFRKSQSVNLNRKRHVRSLRKHTTLLCMTIFFVLHAPLQFVMCVLMIKDAEWRRVGSDVAATVLWFLVRSSFYVCTALYQPALLRSIMDRSQSDRRQLLMRPATHTWILTFCHLLLGMIVVVPLARPGDARAQLISWWIFCGGTAIVFFVIGAQAFLLKKRLTVQLDNAFNYHKRDEIKATKERMEVVQNLILKHGVIQGVIYSAFAGVPYLWSMYDVLLPISWFSISATARVVMRTLELENKKNLQREGISTIVSEARKEAHVLSATDFGTHGTVFEIGSVGDPNLLATGGSFFAGNSGGLKTENSLDGSVSVAIDSDEELEGEQDVHRE